MNERVNTTARVLLNRLDLSPGSSEIARALLPNLSGANFVAAVQILNKRVNKAVSTASRGDWSTDELSKAMDLLPEILETEVRRLKAKQREHAEAKARKKEAK